MKNGVFILFISLISFILKGQENEKYFVFNNDTLQILPLKYSTKNASNSDHRLFDSIPNGIYIDIIDSNSFDIINIEDMSLNGPYQYYENYELVESGYYKYGYKSGIWKKYRKDKVVAIYYYKNSYPTESETYYENGSKKYRSILIEEGEKYRIILTTKWYPNGNKEEQGLIKIDSKCNSCVDCCKYKSWTYWHENGNVKSIGEYFKTKENGTWVFYDSTGFIFETIEYKKGNVKSLTKYYSELRENQYIDVIEVYNKENKLKSKIIEYYTEDFLFIEIYNRKGKLVKRKKESLYSSKTHFTI
ncbi:MAG: repeat variant [Bacteroidetes bacterium]|nr:repeat variant [Bacteroidota bacterium]